MTTRWGILATGKIARRFATDLREVPGATLAAVGSRSRESAEAFAREYGDGRTRAHTSYEGLAEDPDVDVVYIASPHSFHLEHARAVLAGGKAVLCEKPLALTRAEGEALFEAAGDLFCMEGMWTACHPLVVDLRARFETGELGRPRQVLANFGLVVAPDAAARMWDPALGAGALLDLGVYPLWFARMVLGPFTSVSAAGDLAETGIDLDVAIAARHADGGVSALSASMTSITPVSATVATDRGTLLLPERFHHPSYADWSPLEGEPRRFEPPSPILGSGLGNEALHVQECLREGLSESPLAPRATTLEILGVMDDVRAQLGVRYAADSG